MCLAVASDRRRVSLLPLSADVFHRWLFGQVRPALVAGCYSIPIVCLLRVCTSVDELGDKPDDRLFLAVATLLATVASAEWTRSVITAPGPSDAHMTTEFLLVGVAVMWRLCWVLMASDAVISDWLEVFTSRTAPYARWAWASGGIMMAFPPLSLREQRLSLLLIIIGGLASGVVIYRKTGDARGLSTFSHAQWPIPDDCWISIVQ